MSLICPLILILLIGSPTFLINYPKVIVILEYIYKCIWSYFVGPNQHQLYWAITHLYGQSIHMVNQVTKGPPFLPSLQQHFSRGGLSYFTEAIAEENMQPDDGFKF